MCSNYISDNILNTADKMIITLYKIDFVLYNLDLITLKPSRWIELYVDIIKEDIADTAINVDLSILLNKRLLN